MSTPWGGSWSNAEDQVLLAACAKYGVGTSWARISSLIPRKTPKQCKARYEMYLNPTIKKTEWTADEDRRLLHMTKSFPSGQWATVAVMMDGRTQFQCQERYNKLLDEQAAREQKELGDGLVPAEAAPSEEARRLQPGEIDTQAESRPAKYGDELFLPTTEKQTNAPPRRDVINMDGVDLEMLQEARARMANTAGKKAKRKERERRAHYAFQMARLGKRNELKLSGINIKINNVKKGQMDYNADIPFERAPAPGFHDTSDEIAQNERDLAAFDPRKQQLTNNNKRKGEENDEDDSGDFHKKRKDGKGDQQGPSVAALKAAQMQKIREAEQSSQRRPLVLPAPQVSDYELEGIVKVGMSGQRATDAALAGDNAATRGLVSEYGGTVGATPMRTPFRTPGPMATPLRRDLSLAGPSSGGITTANRLASLPKPQMTDWEFEMPEEEAEMQRASDTPEDAAVRDAKAKEAREAAEWADFRRQTMVVQKRLPRPSVVDYNKLVANAEAIEDPVRRAVALESAKLISNDAIKFGGATVIGKAPTVESLSVEARAEVRHAVEEKCSEFEKEVGMSKEEVLENLVQGLQYTCKIPGLDSYDSDDDVDEVQLMAQTLDSVKERIMRTAEKGNELEKKLKKYHGGYIARAKTLTQKINEAYEALEKINLNIYTATYAKAREEAAIARAIEKKTEEVRIAKAAEMEAQEEYRQLKAELDAQMGAQAQPNGSY